MPMLPSPDRRQLLLPILIAASVIPLSANGWGLEGSASARFDRTHLPKGSTLYSAQFSASLAN